MSNLYLFESGSTKTNVFVCEQEIARAKMDAGVASVDQLNFSGFNPNRPETSFLQEVTTLPICADDHVCFYGSGLGSEESKDKLANFFRNTFKIEPAIFDDITGAGRALYHDQKGVLAILGTGACVAYFDGTQITKRRGGYGYLIDDLGGGYELGKLIISKWLNNDFDNQISEEIAHFLQLSRENFIVNYYSNLNLGSTAGGLKMIAGVVEVAAKYPANLQIKETLDDYFDVFLQRHVLQLCAQNSNFEIRAVGSIAHYFEANLKERAQLLGITLTKVIQFPANELLKFHLRQLSSNNQLNQAVK